MALVAESPPQTVGTLKDGLQVTVIPPLNPDEARFRREITDFGAKRRNDLSQDTLDFVQQRNPQFHRELAQDMAARQAQAPPPGFSLGNTLKQIPGGIVDAATEFGQAIGGFADYLRDQFPLLKELDPGNQFHLEVPQIEPSTSTAGNIVRGASQFLAGFLPFFRATKVLGPIKGGLAAGALTDFTVFDPNDPTLTQTIAEAHPKIQGPFTELMTVDPNDPELLNRFKRSIEGLGLGVLGEGLLKAGKMIVLGRQAKTGATTTLESTAEVVPRTSRSTRLVPDAEPQVIGELEPVPPSGDPRLPLERTGESLPLTDGKRMAGSVNLDRIQTDEDVKLAIEEASKIIPKPETITDDQIEQAAQTMGFTLPDAEALAQMTTKQRAQTLAARDVGVALAERYESARKAFVDNPTSEGFTALKDAEAAFLRGFKAQQTIASNAGSTLRSFQIQAKGVMGKRVDREINRLLGLIHDKGPIGDDVTLRLATLNKENPEEVATFLQFLSAKTASGFDKLYEAWLSSILSGPQTHAANLLGNTATHMIRPLERVGAATADIFLSPLQWKQRDRFFGEAVVDIWGMMGAIGDASRAFSRTFRTGIRTTGSKVELPAQDVAIQGKKGALIRSPLRFLSASDEFFKALGRRGDLYARAYRSGARQGKSGKALWEHIQDVRQNPPEAMLQAIDEEAAYRTFTKRLGKGGEAIINMRNSLKGSRYLVPFITTPINIAKFGLERTPLKAFDILHTAAKRQFKEGELAEDMGKLATSVALSWWIAHEVIAGNVTGTGPSNAQDRVALLQSKQWQPLSFKAGDQWVSYARIEPFATAIGIMADATELIGPAMEAGILNEEQVSDVMTKMFQLVTQNITDKTFLQGLTEFSDVLHDPERFLGSFLESRARAVVPSVVGQAARAQDPLMRDILGIMDSVRAQLPKIGEFEGRQGLYPVRNIFGEPIDQEGNFWYRWLSPIKVSTIGGTPSDIVIANLGVRFNKLERTITVPKTGKEITLTPAEYDKYQVLVGTKFKELVDASTFGSIVQRNPKEAIKILRRERQIAKNLGLTTMLADVKKRGAF